MRDLAARAWVDGQPITLTELPTRTLSSLRGRSTCAVAVRDLPAGEAGKPAQVDLLVNGKSTRFFTGLTAERGSQAATMQRTTNLVDLLDLDKALPSQISWSHRSFPDAVRDLLTAAGIAAADIDSVFDPGSVYTLGDVYPIVLKTTENISQLFRTLMEFGGASAYVTPSGRVRVVDSPGIPASTSATIYADGADLDAGELGIFDAGVQLEGNESVISVYTATGPKTPSGAVPDGTFTASGIVGKPDGKSFRFAQTDAVCQAIAERELSRRARARVNLWISAPLNISLLPGDTILFRCARLGYAENKPAYVMEASTAADGGMRLIVSIGPSKVSGYASSIAPPEADFSMRVEHQLVTLAGVPVASYLVQCQDASRDRAGYAIASRAWVASGPGAAPTSSSDPAPIFLFTDLTGTTIALTATSASGESATVTRTPKASDLQVLSRVVSAACGSSGWRVLATIAGWRSFAAPGGASCTAVPGFNESGPLLSGWSSGAIYATSDALATLPALLTTLAGSIGALHVNEADRLDIIAGHGSTLSRSQDGGATWAAIGTFADSVTDCQSSPTNPGEIRVTAGDAMHVSYDGGTSWAVATQGIAGSIAAALATAPWGHGAVFSGVGSAVAEAVQFEEAHTVDWSGVDPASQPADGLTSITPLLEEQAFVVGEAADLIRDGALPALVLSAGAGNLYKLIWSGAGFTASMLPPATGSGAGKLVTLAAHYPIDSASAQRIGYGALGAPLVAPGNLIIPTWGVSGANDGIWIHDSAGWRMVAPPVAGAYWKAIGVNPFNSSEWVIAGDSSSACDLPYAVGGALMMSDGAHSAVWHTSDAGATWTAVALAIPDVGTSVYYIRLNTTAVLWPDTGGWAICANWWRTDGSPFPVVWRATGGYYRGGTYDKGGIYAIGQDGDIVVGRGDPHVITSVTPSGSWTSSLNGPGYTNFATYITVVPGGRTVYAVNDWTGDIWRSSDYRVSDPAVWAGAPSINGLVACSDGSVYGYRVTVAGSTEIMLVRSDGSSAVAYSAVTTPSYLVSNASRGAIAGAATTGIVYWDGTTWSLIPYPTGTTHTNFGRLAVTDESL